MGSVLKVEELYTSFQVKQGEAKVVNGLSFEVKEGQLLGLVGESGSGKSVAAASSMGRVRKPGVIKSGRVIYGEEVDILQLPEDKARAYRGKEISLIAANARGHLNPLLTVGDQIVDTCIAHGTMKKKEARAIAVEMLKAVGIPDPQRRFYSYPHELSGGMAQRCMIAMALVNSPRLLIADDATNGLDVTVQAQIMDLIIQMIKTRKMSGVFITHDLGVVAQCCDEIAIMYCGQIVEQAAVGAFYDAPCHPYSVDLMGSLPEKLGDDSQRGSKDTLVSPLCLPSGCMYHPRCRDATKLCRMKMPELCQVSGTHWVRCHHAKQLAEKGGAKDGGIA